MYGQQFPLVDLGAEKRGNDDCVIELRPGLHCRVPLAVTDRAADIPPQAAQPLCGESVRHLLATYTIIVSQQVEDKEDDGTRSKAGGDQGIQGAVNHATGHCGPRSLEQADDDTTTSRVPGISADVPASPGSGGTR